MKNHKVVLPVIIACFLSAFVAGCNFNLFSFLHKETADAGSNAVDEHIAEGRKLMNLGGIANYEEAAEEFQYAIEKGSAARSNVIDAYYYHAVAYSRSKGVDALEIMINMVKAIGSDSSTELLLGMEKEDIIKINDASGVAKDDLWTIFTSSQNAEEFRSIEIRPENVYFDLTMCSTLKAVTSIAMFADKVSNLMLKFDGTDVDWSNTDSWDNLTHDEQTELKSAVVDSMDAAETVMEILYPDQDNEVKNSVSEINSFFNGLIIKP